MKNDTLAIKYLREDYKRNYAKKNASVVALRRSMKPQRHGDDYANNFITNCDIVN